MASWLFPWPMATLMLAAAVPGVLGMQSMEPQVRVLILEAESLPLAAQQQPLVPRPPVPLPPAHRLNQLLPTQNLLPKASPAPRASLVTAKQSPLWLR